MDKNHLSCQTIKKPEYVLTRNQVEYYTPFFQRKKWFEEYLETTKQILTEMSHDNPCNYLELSRGHIDFSDALNSALKAGKEYHRLLYDVGYFYPLREEYEEDKAETLQRINTSHTKEMEK